MIKKAINILAFIIFTTGQLSIVGALWFNSFYVEKWLSENRSGAVLPTITIWLFKSGPSPYIQIALILTAVSLICKIFDRHFPFLFVLVSSGIECVFIATYIIAISCIKSHWGSLINPN
jgi:hypothetical protein